MALTEGRNGLKDDVESNGKIDGLNRRSKFCSKER